MDACLRLHYSKRDTVRPQCAAPGIQHDELKTAFGTIPNFFGITWTYGARKLPKMENSEFSDATMHRSVYERFDMGEVPDYNAMTEYRPGTLANHLDFKD